MVDLPKSLDHRQRTAPIAHHPQTVNALRHQVYPTSWLQSIWTNPPGYTKLPVRNGNVLPFIRFDKRTSLAYSYKQQNQFVF